MFFCGSLSINWFYIHVSLNEIVDSLRNVTKLLVFLFNILKKKLISVTVLHSQRSFQTVVVLWSMKNQI